MAFGRMTRMYGVLTAAYYNYTVTDLNNFVLIVSAGLSKHPGCQAQCK